MTTLDIGRLLDSLEDTPDQDLVAACAITSAELKALAKQKGIMEAELARRMYAAGARRLITDEWWAELTATRTYRWDAASVERWLDGYGVPRHGYVTKEVVPQHTEYKVHTSKVLALAKSLGKDAEIAECYAIDEGPPRISYVEANTGYARTP